MFSINILHQHCANMLFNRIDLLIITIKLFEFHCSWTEISFLDYYHHYIHGKNNNRFIKLHAHSQHIYQNALVKQLVTIHKPCNHRQYKPWLNVNTLLMIQILNNSINNRIMNNFCCFDFQFVIVVVSMSSSLL